MLWNLLLGNTQLPKAWDPGALGPLEVQGSPLEHCKDEGLGPVTWAQISALHLLVWAPGEVSGSQFACLNNRERDDGLQEQEVKISTRLLNNGGP